MTLLEAIILGIVQGATEFLPISSTAHLRIVPALCGWGDPGAAFSAVIQCGTLIAVIAYFRHDISRIATAWLREQWAGTRWQTLDARLGWMIIIGTLPVVVFGLAFRKLIKTEARSLYVMAAALIVVGLVMLLAEFYAWRRRRRIEPRDMQHLHLGDAVTVGLAQALALVPGTSRSGITISAGLFAGLSRETAARFSFLLSLPAILAAAVHELWGSRQDLFATTADVQNLVVATVVSGIVGYLSIAFLLAYIRKHTTVVFVVYRLLLAGLLLWLLSSGRLAA